MDESCNGEMVRRCASALAHTGTTHTGVALGVACLLLTLGALMLLASARAKR